MISGLTRNFHWEFTKDLCNEKRYLIRMECSSIGVRISTNILPPGTGHWADLNCFSFFDRFNWARRHTSSPVPNQWLFINIFSFILDGWASCLQLRSTWSNFVQRTKSLPIKVKSPHIKNICWSLFNIATAKGAHKTYMTTSICKQPHTYHQCKHAYTKKGRSSPAWNNIKYVYIIHKQPPKKKEKMKKNKKKRRRRRRRSSHDYLHFQATPHIQSMCTCIHKKGKEFPSMK